MTDDQLVLAAQSLRRPPVEQLLRAHYSRVCRIAGALCGRKNTSQGVIRGVMRLSINFLGDWQTAQEAENWFIHHTVLASRLAAKPDIPPAQDCLVEHVDRPTGEYIAFVKSLRNLSPQQREAFILARCERLEPRQVAVAMDCSTAAAANHLIAANQKLSAIAGSGFDSLASALARIYASLTPPEELIVGEVGSAARRVTRRRLRKYFLRLLSVAVLGLFAWTVWRLSHMIEI